jgi:putative iron-only hydrogenase system regulator
MAGRTEAKTASPEPADRRRRIGVVGIVVTDRAAQAGGVQEILSGDADLIVGRLGIPYRERGVSVIALVVDGDTDRLGALTGKLGGLEGTHVRSALTSFADLLEREV